MPNDKPKFYSLCMGIGGFDDGLIKAGFECVGGCEIDEYARGISYQKYPGIKIDKDAKTVDAGQLRDFDLLTCGFPCPSFSVAGKRLGFDDPRGEIFFEIARIAKAKRPKVLLLENVKGLLSHDSGKTFGTMVDILVTLGYSLQWQVINSKWFVPQNRERIYIIGYLGDKCPGTVLPIIGEDQRDVGKDPKIKKVGNINKAQSGNVYSPEGIATTLCSGGGGQGAKTGLYEEPKIKKVVDGAQGERVYDPSGINQCLSAEAGGGGAKMGMVTVNKIMAESQRYCVYTPDGLSPTLCSCTHGWANGYTAVVNNGEKGLREIEDDKTNCLCSTYYKGYDNHGERTLIVESEVNNIQRSGRGEGEYEERVKEGFGQVGTGSGGSTRGQETLVSVKPILTPDRMEKRQNGRRMKDDGEPAHTLTAQDKHGIVLEEKKICAECGGEVPPGGSDTGANHFPDQPDDKTRIRRLTPVECERLQGFADNSTKYGLFKKVKNRMIADPVGEVMEVSDTQRYKTLGNAVTVDVIEMIGKRLIKWF